MFRNRSHENFIAKFKDSRKDAEEYTFLTEYIASNAPITVRHEPCETVFEVQPVRLTRRRSPAKCPKCGNHTTKKKTPQDIEKEVHLYGKGQFSLVSDLIGNGLHRLTVEHTECGYQFEIYRNNMVIWGLSCPNCEKEKVVTPNECRIAATIELRVDHLSDGKYKVISTYSGYNDNITVRNTETKNQEEVPYSRFMNRLKIEFPDREVDKEREREIIQSCIEDEVFRESSGRYKLISPYEGYKGRVEVLDTQTNRVDKITYSSLRARIRKMDNYQKCLEIEHSVETTE